MFLIVHSPPFVVFPVVYGSDSLTGQQTRRDWGRDGLSSFFINQMQVSQEFWLLITPHVNDSSNFDTMH
jgi:hypothetical protein